MTYPGDNAGQLGEQVTYTYLPQNVIDTVTGNATYVNGSIYDASGRITSQAVGTGLKTTYQYYPWTSQGGRLQYLKSGTTGSPTSLQYFSYSYDNVGNITSILDYNAGGTQTQSFGYDFANRLTSASASGGSGGTYANETYSYDPNTGTLNSKVGVSFLYADGNHKHAVTHLSGSQKYWYDDNGNMTTRVRGHRHLHSGLRL